MSVILEILDNSLLAGREPYIGLMPRYKNALRSKLPDFFMNGCLWTCPEVVHGGKTKFNGEHNSLSRVSGKLEDILNRACL